MSAPTVTISGTSVTVATCGTVGPAGSTANGLRESGTSTFNGTAGRDITFSSALADTGYMIIINQTALSGEERFCEDSMGEYSIESKTTTGFTVKTPDYMTGVGFRWGVLTY